MKTTFFATVFSVLLFTSCHQHDAKHIGNSDFLSRNVQVDDFDKIKIGGGYQIVLEEGTSPEVIVKADENLMDLININVIGSRLVIDNEETLHSPEGIEITIIYSELSAIEVSGACTLKNEGVITADDFKVEMGGAGALDLVLDVNELTIDISGAGAIELEGETKYLDINMSGAGGLSAYELISEKCRIDISGVGGAELYVEEELTATVSGLGGISYKGDPSLTKNQVSGLGAIHRVR